MAKSSAEAAADQQEGTDTFSMVTEDPSAPSQPVVCGDIAIPGGKRAEWRV